MMEILSSVYTKLDTAEYNKIIFYEYVKKTGNNELLELIKQNSNVLKAKIKTKNTPRKLLKKIIENNKANNNKLILNENFQKKKALTLAKQFIFYLKQLFKENKNNFEIKADDKNNDFDLNENTKILCGFESVLINDDEEKKKKNK